MQYMHMHASAHVTKGYSHCYVREAGYLDLDRILMLYVHALSWVHGTIMGMLTAIPYSGYVSMRLTALHRDRISLLLEYVYMHVSACYSRACSPLYLTQG